MVQRAARPPRAVAAAVASRHQGAGRSRRSRAAVPDGADRTGDDAGADRRDPRRGHRHPAAVAADAADARPPARRGARHAGAHLLQGRIGFAVGFAQDEHRGRAGVLQPRRRHEAHRDRNRRRSVGERAVVRVRAVRHRVQGLHGAGVVRAEAVPPRAHGDVGRNRRAVARRRSRPPGFARQRDQRRGPRRGHARRLALRARLGAQSRAAAPDDHRARSEGAAAARGRGRARRRDRVLRRRLEPRRHRAAVHDRPERAAARGRARVVSHAHRRQVRVRLRRHRRDDAAAADVHARPRLRAAVDPRGRVALSRRLAGDLAARAGGPDGRRRVPAGQDVRGRGAVRAGRRARSPRPRPATRSAPRSTRRSRPRRAARSG